MPVERDGLKGKDQFAKYPPQSYSVLPQELVKTLTERRVGRNGWAVMVALCRKVYRDGRLGRSSAVQISERTGLTKYQIARGMTELRDKGVIVPVYRKTAEGFTRLDHSNFGHVAQYCISKDIWENVEVEELQ